MSNAVMPLADYKNACDTIREHLAVNLLDGATFEEITIPNQTMLASSTFNLVAGKEYVLDFPKHTNTNWANTYVEKTDWNYKDIPLVECVPLQHHFTVPETAEYRVYCADISLSGYPNTTGATLVLNSADEKIKSGELANNIVGVYTTGLQEGKKAEYDRFWDAFQENGSKKGYLYAFSGRGWSDDTFKPKYPLTGITNGNSMFAYSGVKNIDCEIEIAVTGDSVRSMFASAWVERIKLLKVNESLSYTGSFSDCSKLQDIRIGGVIGKTVSFSASPLNFDSIISIIEHLSSTSTGQKLTLKKSAVDTAFETSKGAADGSTNPDSCWVSVLTWKPNWTITLA